MTAPRWLAALGPRDRRALRIGGWIVVPVLLATLVARPLANAWIGQRSALFQERALLARELRLVAESPRDRDLLRTELQALDAAAPRLFGGADAVSASAALARYVTRAARESGLSLEQAETETALDRAAAGPLPNGSMSRGTSPAEPPLRVSIRASGDIEEVVAFLGALEEGDRLVRVEQVTIAAGDEATGDDRALLLSATVSALARLGTAADTTATPAATPASRNRFVSRSEP